MATTTNKSDVRQVAIDILDSFEPYYVLMLLSVGLVGNTISFAIFVSSRLRRKESNYILASLSLVDNCFLVTLTLVNLKHLGVDLFNRYAYVCKLTVFSTYVCGFLSVWLVTLFSIERFIAVMFPLKRFTICSHKRNRLFILMLVVFAVVFYSFALGTSGLESDEERPKFTRCVTYEKWFEVVKALSSVDIIVTILVPFTIILAINISISFKLSGFASLYRRMAPSSILPPLPPSYSIARSRPRPPQPIPIHEKKFCTGLRSWSTLRPNPARSDLSLNAADTAATPPLLQPTNVATANNNNNSNEPHLSPSRKLNHLMSSSSTISTNYKNLNNNNNNNNNGGGEQVVAIVSGSNQHHSRFKSYSRTTRTLIIISITYILLNSLMAFSKLRHLFDVYTEDVGLQVGGGSGDGSVQDVDLMTSKGVIISLTDDNNNNNSNDDHLLARSLNNELLERISCYLYYLNFSINFFLYVLNKSTFREILFGLFRGESGGKTAGARTSKITKV